MGFGLKNGLKVATVALVSALFAGCSMQRGDDQLERIHVTGASLPQTQEMEVTVKVRTRRPLYEEVLEQQKQLQIFKRYGVNPTVDTVSEPVSTFSMDVDNGSYKLAAQMLQNGSLPNPDGVRVEEFVNAMSYSYHRSEQVFGISVQAMPSPFRPGFHVLHVGLQTRALTENDRSPSNLVLVADVSGSMADDNKLGLLKDAFTTLVSQLRPDDKVAIVSYADEARVVIPATYVFDKRKIFAAIGKLQSGGGTNAAKGITRAYQMADEMFQPGYNNRVILTSDGMANAGKTDPQAIISSIEAYKQKGIFLTTVGVGLGMYNDHLLEQLANMGNGHYLYFGNQEDIQTAFVDGLDKQLQAVAKDAKVQLTFDPAKVSSYRLLGYENRGLKQQDFTDGQVDGGELGAGHRVTALYEIKLVAGQSDLALGKIAVAWKKPLGNKVYTNEKSIPASVVVDVAQASDDTKLSVAVAAFAEKLRQSYWSRAYGYGAIRAQLSDLSLQYQQQRNVERLIEMVDTASRLDYRQDPYNQEITVSKMNFNRVPLLD